MLHVKIIQFFNKASKRQNPTYLSIQILIRAMCHQYACALFQNKLFFRLTTSGLFPANPVLHLLYFGLVRAQPKAFGSGHSFDGLEYPVNKKQSSISRNYFLEGEVCSRLSRASLFCNLDLSAPRPRPLGLATASIGLNTL